MDPTAPPEQPVTRPVPQPPAPPTAPQQQPQAWPPHPAAAGHPGGPPPVTYQPGVIAFRPLGMGEIYGAAFKIIKGNPASTVGIALLVALVALIPTTPLGLWVARQGSSDAVDPNAPLGESFGTDGILVTIGQYIPTLAGSLATVALAGFIAYVTGQAVLGRKVKLPETWQGTRPHLLRVIGVSLLVSLLFVVVVAVFLVPGIGIAVAGGTSGDDGMLVTGLLVTLGLGLLLIPVMLLLWTRLAFVGPIVVLERSGIGSALSRSWRLTRFPGFWRILGIRILTFILISTITQILVVPLTFGMLALTLAGDISLDGLVTAQVIFGAVITLITAAASTPVMATIDTLLYVDARIRTEALDVGLIQAVEGRAPLPWLPAHDAAGAAGTG